MNKNKCENEIANVWTTALKNEGSIRSPDKTNVLHAFVGSWIASHMASDQQAIMETHSVTDCRLEIDDMYGEKFHVDGVITEHDDVKVAVLVKSPLFSINKNRFNMINNLFGELIRLSNQKTLKIVFVNIIPRKTWLSSKNTLKNETVKDLDIAHYMACSALNDDLKSRVSSINLYYDIASDFLAFKNKKDLYGKSFNGKISISDTDWNKANLALKKAIKR